MELSNHTAVAAQLHVARMEGASERRCLVVAKATFRLAGHEPELCCDDPFPIFGDDEPCDAGLLPGDLLPRQDPAFELVVLGAAYPARTEPCTERRVSLSVGDFNHELLVSGDRRWERAADGSWRISRPEPFARMPLSYARAFGGRVTLEIDADSALEVRCPRNPAGRGFDPEPYALGLGAALQCPEGYPRYPCERLLPNIEAPHARVRTRADRPTPVGWATVPFGTVIDPERFVRLPTQARARDLLALDWSPAVFHRAHPELVIPLPAPGVEVRLTGVLPEGRALAFALPRLGVAADHVIGAARGSLALAPHMLVILPERARAYVVYRRTFTFDPGTTERSVRLRLTQSWGS